MILYRGALAAGSARTLPYARGGEPTLIAKIANIPWGLVALLSAIAGIGCAVLYSAGNGSMQPWAAPTLERFGVALFMMLVVAMVDLRLWYRLAYPIYFLGLVLLVLVDLKGVRGLGAQRWLVLGPLSLQPSELMKIGLVMALARYFNTRIADQLRRPQHLLVPLAILAVPAVLVMKQPDLGTAIMLVLETGAMLFLAGVSWWYFALGGAAAAAAAPVAWGALHDYQRRRVLTFLDPESDALGAGYHITQSKIALGSGGFWGKGFLQGTQGRLDFLPEKQTDFIFTAYAEEFGLVGGLALLGLFATVFAYGYLIGLRSRNQFGRLLALGITANLFFYVFINIAMVMGLLPVVGVPLPLISYGGTAMLTVMFGFGLMACVWVHRDLRINRRGEGEF